MVPTLTMISTTVLPTMVKMVQTMVMMVQMVQTMVVTMIPTQELMSYKLLNLPLPRFFNHVFRTFTTDYPEMLRFFQSELEPNYCDSNDRTMDNNEDATLDDVLNQTFADLTNSQMVVAVSVPSNA